MDWPDAAILDASSLYFMSNGVLGTNPFASSLVVNGTSYAANKLTENSVGAAANHPPQQLVPDCSHPVQHHQPEHGPGSGRRV